MAVNDKVKGNSGRQGQRRLWEDLVVNPLPGLVAAMNEALEASGLSREQLAEDMNRLAHLSGSKRRVSSAMLDKWLAGTPGYVIYLDALHLFCQALGSNRPLSVYARAFPGARVISEARYRVLEWAEAEINAREAKKIAKKKAQGVGLE
ncbi:MAG: hypothetical protein D4R73_02760 [Deltaproteobacteria bacterium]|nr:MAG: hypothetical protein D4R73_02760 [Deltaproteobacteria bacterium]